MIRQFSREKRNPPARRRGTALVIVMWIALGLVSLALYFGQSARWAYLAGENGLAAEQAEQAIEGARRYITYVLNNMVQAGEAPDLDDGDYVAEAAAVGEGRFWLIGRDPDSDVPPSEPVWGLVDEASKLNLNTATLEMLEALPGMTTALAAAILDWRDTDNDLTSEGAESQDYELLDTPYSAKNGPFESVEELRLVMGMDLAILWGEDANGNGALDDNENDGDKSLPADDADGRLDPGLAEYVTVWSREPNTSADGSERINITGNSAARQVRQLLEENFGAARANEILNRIGPGLRTLGSPIEFYLAGGLTEDEFARIEGEITTTGGSHRVGLVNVRTAPAAVLACLPGMDTAKAGALVSRRRDLSDSALESTAWVAAALDAATVRAIGPWITARSYQFSADIAAVGANGRGFRRSFLVFDREEDAKVIYRRDRARLGWPLGVAPRQELLARASR